MTKDKKILYATSLIIFAVFFAILFIDVRSSRIVAAVLLLLATPAVCILIKKRASGLRVIIKVPTIILIVRCPRMSMMRFTMHS